MAKPKIPRTGPRTNAAIAGPGGIASRRRTPWRQLIPEASPVTVTRIDGSTREIPPYTAGQAAAIIARGQVAGTKKGRSRVRAKSAVKGASPRPTYRGNAQRSNTTPV